MSEIKPKTLIQQQIEVLQVRLDNVNVIRKQTLDLALLDLFQQMNVVIETLRKENVRLTEENEKLKKGE